MSGKKPKKAKQIRQARDPDAIAHGENERPQQENTSPPVVRENPVDEAREETLTRVREVPRPRLMLFLSLAYAAWLSLLVWLAGAIL